MSHAWVGEQRGTEGEGLRGLGPVGCSGLVGQWAGSG